MPVTAGVGQVASASRSGKAIAESRPRASPASEKLSTVQEPGEQLRPN